MAIGIHTNPAGLGAAQQTSRAAGLLNKSIKQAASGLRINKAADDAAGLAIAEKFNALARQFAAEDRNLQYGISAGQTAESGLAAQQDNVQRLRELALQAANGTLSDSDRQALNAEAQQLLGQINDTADAVEFNGQQLLKQDQSISLGAGGAVLNLQQSDTDSLGLGGIDLSTQEGAQAAVAQLDNALNNLSTNRSGLAAQLSGFESAIRQRQQAAQSAVESESRIRDLDVARASIERTRGQVLLQAALSGVAQGNIAPQTALRLLGN